MHFVKTSLYDSQHNCPDSAKEMSDDEKISEEGNSETAAAEKAERNNKNAKNKINMEG